MKNWIFISIVIFLVGCRIEVTGKATGELSDSAAGWLENVITETTGGYSADNKDGNMDQGIFNCLFAIAEASTAITGEADAAGNRIDSKFSQGDKSDQKDAEISMAQTADQLLQDAIDICNRLNVVFNVVGPGGGPTVLQSDIDEDRFPGSAAERDLIARAFDTIEELKIEQEDRIRQINNR